VILSVVLPSSSPPPPVPEPSTLLCWSGLLLGGVFWTRRMARGARGGS
jgi:hypothetical protein